ncbi:MAG: hypothetical protein IT521_04085 [Burkholderiales bacterium]|nr:hypothetical protein [Burkholderiales bacterium]
MIRVRRVLLLLLLVTVPFQAALGATGSHRVTDTHPAQDAGRAHLGHDAAASGHLPYASDIASVQHGSIADPGPFQAHDAAGKCKLCSECSFSSAAIPAASHEVTPPSDTALRVSSFVEPDLAFHAGDKLFRPPRTCVA